MINFHNLAAILITSILFFTPRSFNERTGTPDQNPLLQKWVGPYGGVPALDKVKPEHFKSALNEAMSENLSEIEKIASNPAAPTFENTIMQMERSGRTLDRVQRVYGIWSSTMSSPEFQNIEREMEPLLAAFFDKITQNQKLFQRIETVYNSPDKNKLTKEQQRLVWVYFSRFSRAGAKLNDEAKAQLSKINQQLSVLFTRFSQNLLADESEQMLVINDENELKGLPQSLRDAASSAAAAKNIKGWVIRNTRSSVDPFLTYAADRNLREKAWRMFVNRGDNGDKHDNNAIITEILQLRLERTKLLGYATHAHWRLENSMAKTPEKALELMETVWKPAVAKVAEEVADMQAIVQREETTPFKIEPWDYRYYAEKVRKQKYDLDENEIKPYLQLDKMREGMFWVAGELFGFKFSLVTNVPVCNPDVKVWEVTDKKTGRAIGVWYFDPYARDGKNSGAWMNAYRDQERMDENITTIVSNNTNFIKPKPGDPVLISWTDATTLFHEFGHALHGLSSNVTYPTLSGTSVVRDYVEFPSQLLEHWLITPEVLQRFAVHYQTGKPIPQVLVDRLNNSSKFNQGFKTVEALSSALVDMKLHLSTSKIDPDAFERETLQAINMPKEIVMRHRTPQFGHIFSGDNYSAGYYSYLWSDVITADAYEAFTEAKGPYDQEVVARLIKNVFSVGNTIDPAEGYRAFRGRDPKIEALMKKRGLVSK